MEKLHLKDIKQTLPHMRVTLMPHQIIGVSWMVSQEADDKYCGGILALVFVFAGGARRKWAIADPVSPLAATPWAWARLSRPSP